MIRKKAILEQYNSLLLSLISKSQIPSYLHKDAYQQSILLLYQARKTYIQSKGSMCTWIYWVVRAGLQEYLLKQLYPYGRSVTFYRYAKPSTVNVDDILELPARDVDIYQSDERNFIRQEFIKKVNLKYTPLECSIIIDYYLEGMDYKRLVKKYGNVSKMIKTINLNNTFSEIKNLVI